MIRKSTVEQLAKERMAVLDENLFLVSIKISPAQVIQVEIDKKNGNVSIEECVSVSRNIEHNLDRETSDFELHVSSAGLDKPFRVIEQYQKNVGRQVTVLLQNNDKIEGELLEVSEDGVVIENGRKEKIEGKKKKEWIVEQHKLAFDQIKETKIVISFK